MKAQNVLFIPMIICSLLLGCTENYLKKSSDSQNAPSSSTPVEAKTNQVIVDPATINPNCALEKILDNNLQTSENKYCLIFVDNEKSKKMAIEKNSHIYKDPYEILVYSDINNTKNVRRIYQFLDNSLLKDSKYYVYQLYDDGKWIQFEGRYKSDQKNNIFKTDEAGELVNKANLVRGKLPTRVQKTINNFLMASSGNVMNLETMKINAKNVLPNLPALNAKDIKASQLEKEKFNIANHENKQVLPSQNIKSSVANSTAITKPQISAEKGVSPKKTLPEEEIADVPMFKLIAGSLLGAIGATSNKPQGAALVVQGQNMINEWQKDEKDRGEKIRKKYESINNNSTNDLGNNPKSSDSQKVADNNKGSCVENFDYLVSRFPNFSDPSLNAVKTSISSQTVREIMTAAKDMGYSEDDAIKAANLQTQANEKTYKEALICAAPVETNGDDDESMISFINKNTNVIPQDNRNICLTEAVAMAMGIIHSRAVTDALICNKRRGTNNNAEHMTENGKYDKKIPSIKKLKQGRFVSQGEAKGCIKKEPINDEKFKLINKCNQPVNLKYTFSKSNPFSGTYSTIESGKLTFNEATADEDITFYACFFPSVPQTLKGKCL